MPTAAETLSSPAPASPVAPAAPVVPAGLPNATPSGWWDTIKDPEVKTWIASKNAPDAESALQSYRNLEQIFGADKAGRTVMLPKDDKDEVGWKNIASRLGVPDSPDGYKLPLPEGNDGAFAKLASKWFHDAGVTPRAANKIAEAWNGWMGEQIKGQETAERSESEKQMTALEKEWGPKFPEQRELAQRGYREFAKQFGLDDKATMERAESVLGAANLTKFFAGIGSLNTETKFAGADGQGNFSAGAKADAKAQMDQIHARRVKGEITDYQWKNEYEAKYLKLGNIANA